MAPPRRQSARSPALAGLGLAVAEARAAAGLTQEDAAAASGLDPSYYGELERGRRNIGFEALLRVAAGVRVDVHELVRRAVELQP
jgi:transcriptional regulator with XRE-family HTH domain